MAIQQCARMRNVPGLLLRDVRVDGIRRDVRVRDGVVVPDGSPAAEDEIELAGHGGALLPGLHDHHCHLLATAAAALSVDVSTGLDALRSAAPRDGWIRAVGHDGDPDRIALDAIRADVPVRVQHRGGSLWTLNSAGLAALRLEGATPDGVERDGAGRATGRLWRLDHWLAARLPVTPAPDLAPLGARLASYGITGVTDATPMLGTAAGVLAGARHSGALPQRLMLLAADAVLGHGYDVGPMKIVVPDHALPGTDALAEQIAAARVQGRPVAVHAVTRAALLLVLAVLDDVGASPGDRIEHAAVAPPEAIEVMVRLGLRVVTQPSLIARRGDDYLARVDPDDRPHLWRLGSLLAAGVEVAVSSDAPYGDLDPWATLRAARDRCTESGAVVGSGERVDTPTSLRGLLSPAADPGGAPRRITPGAPADLVLLDAPLEAVLADPAAGHVRATVIAGRIVHGDGS